MNLRFVYFNSILKYIKFITIIFSICLNASAEFQPDAEKYISQILQRKTPYKRDVIGNEFIISSVHAYPPGRITAMFMEHLIENKLLNNKIVADVGAGCFALGILAVKYGAKKAIGTDISDYALACARENIILHQVEDKITLLQGAQMQAILPKYKGTIDLILAGAPWDTISTEQYDQLDDNRKPISRSFYDVDDKLIRSILIQSKKLLAPNGKILISSAKNKIERIKQLCKTYKVNYKIVRVKDIHKNGNSHYILELTYPDKQEV